MSEPSRKKNKLAGRVDISLCESAPTNCLAFTSTHPKYPGELDLTEFAVGLIETPARARIPTWTGAFSGRQKLIAELAPHIKLTFSASPVLTLFSVKTALRRWWRFFDSVDHISRVESVADLDDVHGRMQLQEEISEDYTNTFLKVANPARAKLGLKPLLWQKTPRSLPCVDVPSHEQIKQVYHELKHRVMAVIQNWERADSLANAGVNWIEKYDERPRKKIWFEGDVHASYRGLASKLNHPCPSVSMCRDALIDTPTALTRDFFATVYGRYPSRPDVQNFLMLFLLRTGWNGAVALNLDASELDKCVLPHPSSRDHHIVVGIKDRGNSEQIAIGMNKWTTSPGKLLKILHERTEPLRNALKEKLKQLEAKSSGANRELDIAELRRRIRSPWLFVSSRKHNEIDALDIQTYGTGADRKHILQTLIDDINGKSPDKPKIQDMTLGDFRDAYISFVYESSGFSWLLTQLAAGHSSLESLKSYLRNKKWKAHADGKVSMFSTALWKEIQERKVVDPAILYAMVQRGSVTEEQRQRWLQHKDRTRLGVGCKDFKRPPIEIAPHHADGNGCRVQRCTLCSYAIVFDDSVDYIARRLAELNYIKSAIPLITWIESSFEDEFIATEATLNQLFEMAAVAERVTYWELEIATGRHKPLLLEGEYG